MKLEDKKNFSSQSRHINILYCTNMLPKRKRHAFPSSRAPHYFRAPKSAASVTPPRKFSASAMLLRIAIYQKVHRQMTSNSSTSKNGMDTSAPAPCWYQVGLLSCPCTNNRLKRECLHNKRTIRMYAALADCFLSMNSKPTFPVKH